MANINHTVDRSAAFIGATATKGTVLVVDEEPTHRTSLRQALENSGYDVLEARDGGEAIQIITGGETKILIDVVLAGLRMPRLGGIEEVTHLRRRVPHVEVIVMAGSPDDEAAAALKKSGVRDFLIKPFVVQRLLSAVNDAMVQRRFDWLE